MRVLLVRGIYSLDGSHRKLIDIVSLDSREDMDFVAKVLQWPEFLPTSSSDIAGYAVAHLSPLVYLFIGERQKMHDWRVIAEQADELEKGRYRRDHSLPSLDMSVMRDDIPDEAYTALACFRRHLCLRNEKREKEMEPAFIERPLGDSRVLLGLLMVPRAIGRYPSESLIRGNEADEAKQTAQQVIVHWLLGQVRRRGGSNRPA